MGESRNAITSLNAWTRNVQIGRQPLCNWLAVFYHGSDPTENHPDEGGENEIDADANHYLGLIEVFRQYQPIMVKFNEAPGLQAKWPRVAAQRQDPMARCQVVKFDGNEAECKVFVDGYELPRVGFPTDILRLRGLDAGSRFIWIMRDSSQIRPDDIDPGIPQVDGSNEHDEAKLEEVYQEHQRGVAEDGGEWPVYTGPGK